MYSHRILKKYDFFLELLKISIKYDRNPEFRDFFLVSNYIKILKEFEKFVNNLLKTKVKRKEDDSNSLKRIFREELQIYDSLIDNDEKRDMIIQFRVFMNIMDIVDERSIEEEEIGELTWMEEIHNELKRMKKLFIPVLKKINSIKKIKD